MFAGVDIPDSHRSVITPAGESVAIPCERDAPHLAGMPGEDMLQFSRFKTPQSNRLVAAPAGERIAIRAECYAMHSVRLCIECAQMFARLGIPQSHCPVAARCGENSAIRSERQVCHSPLTLGNCQLEVPRLGIPQPRPRTTAAAHHTTIRAKCKAADMKEIFAECAQQFACFGVPQLNFMLARRGKYAFAWTESKTPDIVRVALQRPGFLSGVDIPQLHRSLRKGASESFAIRAERHAVDAIRIRRECAFHPHLFYIPKL